MSRRRTVDEHVVEMRFNNEDFEKKSSATIRTLDNLREKLNFKGSEKGIESLSNSLSKASSSVNVSGLANGIDTISVKFSALQVVGATALSRLTNAAITAASKIKSALNAPINQIIEGGKKRAQNIAEAKFQLEGLGVAWQDIEEDINYGVQDTAYGLDSAAKAAAQLVASQVALGDDMKQALRGISGVAAMTNSEYDDIAHIFTTVAGNGRLMGQQLTQLSTKGFNAASTIADYLHVTEAEVRDMVSKGKIDFATFSAAMDDAFGEHAKDANKTFTGALSNTKAALSRLGADVATGAFESLRQMLVTIIPILKNLKTQLMPIIDALTDGMYHFTGVVTWGLKRINKMVQSSRFSSFVNIVANGLTNAFTKLRRALKRFIDADGIENTFEGLYNIAVALLTPLKSIRDAFRNVFPKTTSDRVTSLSEKFKNFTKKLILSQDAQKGLTRIIELALQTIKLLGKAIKTITGYTGPFIDSIFKMVDAVLSFVGNKKLTKDNPLTKLADNKIIKWLSTNVPAAISILKKKIVDLFEAISEIWNKVKELPEVQTLLKTLKTYGTYILGFILTCFQKIASINLADKINVDKVVDKIGKAVGRLNGFIAKVETFFSSFTRGKKEVDGAKDSVDGLGLKLASFAVAIPKSILDGTIGNKFKDLGKSIGGMGSFFKNGLDKINEFISKLDAGEIIVNAFGVGIVATTFNLADFVGKLSKTTKQAGGAIANIGGFFKEFSKTLKDYKKFNNIKLACLGIIALAGSLAVLTLMDTDKLVAAAKIFGALLAEMAAIVVIFGVLEKFKIITSVSNFTVALVSMGAALFLISLGIAMIGELDSSKIILATLAVSYLMKKLALFSVLLAILAPELSRGAGTLILIATSVYLLAKAATKLAEISKAGMLWSSVGGISVLMGVLGGLALTFKGLKFGSALGALALVGTLYLVALVLVKIGEMDFTPVKENIGQVIGVFGAMIVLSLLSNLGSLEGGVGLLTTALAVYALAMAIAMIGNLPQDVLIQGGVVTGILMVAVGLMMALFAKVDKFGDATQATKSILGLAASVILLAVAMKIVGSIPVDKIEAATIAIGALMLGVTVMVAALTYISEKVGSMGAMKIAPVIALVGAIVLLCVALAVLSLANPEKLITAGEALFLGLIGLAVYMSQLGQVKMNMTTLLAMALAIVAVGVIAASLSMLCEYDWKSILAAAGALAIVLISLGLTLTMLNAIDVSADSVAALLLASVAIIALSAALWVASDAFQKFAMVDWSNAWIGVAVLAAVVAVCALFGGAMLAGLISASMGIAALGAALLVLGVAVIAIGGGLTSVAVGIQMMTLAVLSAAMALPLLVEAFMNFMRSLESNAEEAGQIAVKMAANFITGLIEGFTAGLAKVVNAIQNLADGMFKSFRQRCGIHSPSTVMRQFGVYIIEGLIQGLNLKEKLSKLKNTIMGIGTKLIQWFSNSIHSHSPSVDFKNKGGDIIDGLANGISEDGNALNAIRGVGDDLKNSLDGLDLTTGITPVLDMDNLDLSSLDSSNLSAMLSGSHNMDMASSISVDTTTDLARMMNENTRVNSNMLTEMTNLRNDLDNLSQKVANLKVYMNSNTLVGAIAPDMDKALGVRAVRNSRSNGKISNNVRSYNR